MPLYRDPKSDMPATQFNMKWVEPAGLVKFDFLGLKTLTTLRPASTLLKPRGIKIDLAHIPLDDQKTFEMLGRGETVGVFQLESAGMRKALVEMRADRFEDIIALVALYRPGPMANIPTYCAVKLGEEDAEYLDPKIEPVLKETFGVIIYQEQVMEIARVLSGYSLGEADMLRRAMGKKIKAEMDAQRARFVDGAVERGVAKAKADEIFDLSRQIRRLRLQQEPCGGLCAGRLSDRLVQGQLPGGVFGRLDDARQEQYRQAGGIPQRGPAPRHCRRAAVDQPLRRRFRCSWRMPKAWCRSATPCRRSRAWAKGRRGRWFFRGASEIFRDLGHLASRLNPREVNKKVLEALAAAGAFDEIERDRARAFAAVETILGTANRAQDEALAGQSALFGGGGTETIRVTRYEKLVGGREAAARIRRHRLFHLRPSARRLSGRAAPKLRVDKLGAFSPAPVKQGASAGRLAATVLERAERRTKSGNKMGIVTLSDPSGQYEAILFQEGLNQYRDLLEKGASVLVTLQANVEGEDVRARITLVEKLDEAAARIQKGLRITLHDKAPLPALSEKLKGRAEGEVTLILHLDAPGQEVEIKLPGRYPINPQTSNAIKTIPGVAEVELVVALRGLLRFHQRDLLPNLAALRGKQAHDRRRARRRLDRVVIFRRRYASRRRSGLAAHCPSRPPKSDRTFMMV